MARLGLWSVGSRRLTSDWRRCPTGSRTAALLLIVTLVPSFPWRATARRADREGRYLQTRVGPHEFAMVAQPIVGVGSDNRRIIVGHEVLARVVKNDGGRLDSPVAALATLTAQQHLELLLSQISAVRARLESETSSAAAIRSDGPNSTSESGPFFSFNMPVELIASQRLRLALGAAGDHARRFWFEISERGAMGSDQYAAIESVTGRSGLGGVALDDCFGPNGWRRGYEEMRQLLKALRSGTMLVVKSVGVPTMIDLIPKVVAPCALVLEGDGVDFSTIEDLHSRYAQQGLETKVFGQSFALGRPRPL